jgi:hypothetical protein
MPVLLITGDRLVSCAGSRSSPQIAKTREARAMSSDPIAAEDEMALAEKLPQADAS